MSSSCARGFTLIELLMTLLAVALVLGVGLPSWRALEEEARLTALVSGYLHTFNTARFQAVTEHRRISFCSPDPERGCDPAWSNTLQIFYDDDRNGRADEAEDVVQTVTLPAAGRIRVTLRAFGQTRLVSLRESGQYRQNGTFRFCPRDGTRGRAIVINAAGRARTEGIRCDARG